MSPLFRTLAGALSLALLLPLAVRAEQDKSGKDKPAVKVKPAGKPANTKLPALSLTPSATLLASGREITISAPGMTAPLVSRTVPFRTGAGVEGSARATGARISINKSVK